jgi:hypothetical protein
MLSDRKSFGMKYLQSIEVGSVMSVHFSAGPVVDFKSAQRGNENVQSFSHGYVTNR